MTGNMGVDDTAQSRGVSGHCIVKCGPDSNSRAKIAGLLQFAPPARVVAGKYLLSNRIRGQIGIPQEAIEELVGVW